MNPPPPEPPFPAVRRGAPDAAGQWTRSALSRRPRFSASDLQLHWPRLHAGQGASPPAQAAGRGLGALYHSGEFERPPRSACSTASRGLALANQATAIYANYLEPRNRCGWRCSSRWPSAPRRRSRSNPDNCQALYLAGLCARALQPRASAWRGRWRRAWAPRSRRAGARDRAAAAARRRPRRAGRLPCRGDRQGRLAGRPHDLRRARRQPPSRCSSAGCRSTLARPAAGWNTPAAC